jgi:putative phosphoesterase
MKVGLLSDTHGELENLRIASEKLLNLGVDFFIHLGDDYDDTVIFDEMNIKYTKVPGVFSSYYQDKSIENRKVEIFEGWRVLLTHTKEPHKNDLPSDPSPLELINKKEVDIVFYGHTHIPKIEEEKGVILVNPGHLKKEDKKGYPPSFGVIDFKKDSVDIKIIDLIKGEPIFTYSKKR